MDKSTDALITNTFERRIREASRIAAEFKAPQVTSGASGQLGYAVENDVDWDRAETLAYVDPMNPPYSGTAEYTVTFTGDGSQEYPLAIPLTDIRVNGTGAANRVKFDWAYQAWIEANPAHVRIFSYDQFMTSSADSKLQVQWKISVNYDESPTLRFKLRAQASCPGILSIARTS